MKHYRLLASRWFYKDRAFRDIHGTVPRGTVVSVAQTFSYTDPTLGEVLVWCVLIGDTIGWFRITNTYAMWNYVDEMTEEHPDGAIYGDAWRNRTESTV